MTEESLGPLGTQTFSLLEIRTGAAWRLELDADLLTLTGPDGRIALAVSRDEAARNIRFNWDLLRGRTLSLFAIERIKAHTFRCDSALLATMLDWLPQKPLAEIQKNARLTGVAVVLCGILILILWEIFHWAWGAAFVAAGVAQIAIPRRRFYVVNAGLMTVMAVAQLVLRPFFGLRPAEMSPVDQHIATALGAVLLIWAVQQISMASPNQLLRIARATRDRLAEAAPGGPSNLVRIIIRCNLLSALAFGVYAWGLIFAPGAGAGWAVSPAGTLIRDILVFVALTVFCVVSALLLKLRPTAPYVEAKLSAHVLLVVWVLFLWGVGTNFDASNPLSFFSGALSQGLFLIERPYVWAPLVVLVIAFNRWIAQAIERELEANR